MKSLLISAILLVSANTSLISDTPVARLAKHVTVVKRVQTSVWRNGTITTYAKCFEGHPMANGKLFRHCYRTVACRGGRLGRKIELRYGKHGRVIVTLTDRGRLPLHRASRWQFDATRAVARDLGLYKVVNGKTDRSVRWRYIN